MDLEEALLIQPKSRGDTLVGAGAVRESWTRLFRDPFSSTAVLEPGNGISGHRLVGFGASVLLSKTFANTELAHPQPDINARVIASLCSGTPALASPAEVARANSSDGVDILVLCGTWRDHILDDGEQQQAQTLLAASFVQQHAGYRIARVLCEAVDEQARAFIERSVVYKPVASFPQAGRVLYLMTRDSAEAARGSLGNVLFDFREPVLRLRASDQQLLLAAIRGATDTELAKQLGVTLAAVKGRWRSTLNTIAAVMPDLVRDDKDSESRGSQKRHRVLAYLRTHPEELRPYDWKARTSNGTAPNS